MDKPDCKHHLEDISKYKGTLKQLANDIGDLRYDKMEKLLGYLESKIRRDSGVDKKAGRDKLGGRLTYAAGAISELRNQIRRAWIICAPYMTKTKTKTSGDKKRRLKENVFKRDGNKCLKCGSTEDLTIDHIKPLSKGGSNKKENKQTLCCKCNSDKGDSEIDYRQ